MRSFRTKLFLAAVATATVALVVAGLLLAQSMRRRTDEKLEQFAGTKDQPRAIYDNGRTYYAGVRVKF